jgi:hypothetical protein
MYKILYRIFENKEYMFSLFVIIFNLGFFAMAIAAGRRTCSCMKKTRPSFSMSACALGTFPIYVQIVEITGFLNSLK